MWLRVGGLAAMVLALTSASGCGKMSYGEVTGTNPAGLKDRGFLAKTVVVDGVERKYGVFVPHNYTPTQKYPVIVFLHGVLEGGSDGESQMTVGLGPCIARTAGQFGFITVFPQSPGDWVGEDRARIVIACLDAVQKQFSTDPTCVTLTGVSNGGQGTWVVGGRYPERFSALVPMCAYSAYDWVPQVSRLPIWCFHNSGDILVNSGGTQEMCDRIKAAGGNAKYTKYDGMSHNCWDDAYGAGEVFTWMRAQHRGGVVPVMGSTTGK